jgi:hypothetical protein
MCVHILPCMYACVCACRLEGCAAPSHGEAYLCTLKFLCLSISPLEAMSAKKNSNNKIGTQFYYYYEEDDLDFITILILLCKILIY